MTRKLFCAVALACAACAAWAEITVAEGARILSAADAGRNLTSSDLSATMTMIREDPESGVEKNVVKQYRRDASDQFVFLFLEPAVKKGQGYLRIGDNLWVYDPESRKFSHSSMKDRFADSDARNSDFGISTLSGDYGVTAVAEETLGKYPCWKMELAAKNSDVTYARKRVWISKEGNLLLKSEDMSETGRLLRTSLYPSYVSAGGRTIASKMIFVDELITGKKTTITLAGVSVDPIPDQVFTKAYIERLNK